MSPPALTLKGVTNLLIHSVIETIEKEGIRIKTLPAGTDARGYYSHATKTIWVNPHLSAREQVPVLLHELEHYWRGDIGRQPLHVEQRIDEKVAAQLINASDYARAERIHNGHVGAIADELDAPVWVVRAYQRHLQRAVLT